MGALTYQVNLIICCNMTSIPQTLLTPALARAKRALAILEEQAASFGIRIPVDLQIELEEKRRQVTELESRHQRTGLD
jgi:hypothetical protein